MILKKLIQSLKCIQTIGQLDKNITSVESDSRKCVAGSLFVAIPGTVVDGHSFIDKAVSLGATAIVCETMPAESAQSDTVTYIRVDHAAQALGEILSAWYDDPTSKLKLVGVTGTNGKTTIATLLYDMFRIMGHKTGLLSTVCNYVDDTAYPTDHTTPDPVVLYQLLDQMVKAGCEYAFMEVSSHAVSQQRISGLTFAGGIFTNLTRDHLDYHKTVDNYLKAKKGFFDVLPASAFALTNLDDKSGMVMLQNTAARKLTYSLRTLADFKGKILESHFEGTEMIINGREIMTRFVGRFNAYNLLAVYGTAVSLGKQPDEVLLVLSNLHPVSGRFQTMRSPLGYSAIVDYAHTPDALVNVLNSIAEVLENNGRIITVVGCGGNRDKGKRPIMAKEAAKLSHQLILTSDNPRFEVPEEIIRDMEAGLSHEEMEQTLSITDRAQAIKTAVKLARKGDVILIAGKGHEDYQDVQGVKHHFDDREKLMELFEAQRK